MIKAELKPLRITGRAGMWVSFISHSEMSVSIWLERAFIHQLLTAIPVWKKGEVLADTLLGAGLSAWRATGLPHWLPTSWEVGGGAFHKQACLRA